MALLSIVATSAPWHTIQGLLVNLTWPFPKDNGKPDVTFPLSGMLLHIAMQNGLHIPMSSHEFSKIKVPAPSEADMIRRSELWAHCVIVYQRYVFGFPGLYHSTANKIGNRACAAKGQSARTLVNLEQDPGQSQVLLQKIAPSLVLKVKSQELIARCSAAVLENGVRNMTVEQERALDILLRAFESQMNDLEAQAVSGAFTILSVSNQAVKLTSVTRRRQTPRPALPTLHTSLPLLQEPDHDHNNKLSTPRPNNSVYISRFYQESYLQTRRTLRSANPGAFWAPSCVRDTPANSQMFCIPRP